MEQRFFTTLFLGLVMIFPARAEEVLRVLAWPGYAEPAQVKAFEALHQVRVQLSLVSSDEALRQQVQAKQGGNFDVIAANTVEIKNFIAQKLLRPLNPAQIPRVASQLPRFREVKRIPGITLGEEVFAVPYTYAEMGLIYDRKQFTQPPTSISVMWNPRYQGKVLAFNDANHNFSIASLSMGGKPFQIDGARFDPVVAKLIALRRNVLAFYTLPEESVELFTRHKAAVLFANYGRQQFKLLQDAGADVGYVIPEEGALAWLDCWAIMRGAKNPLLAHQWINFMLDREASEALVQRQGLSNTVSLGIEGRATDRLHWLETVEDEARRSGYWARIVSGDRPERF
jgi:putative spermidine/putrescine transport system substrate-binding protein